MKELKTSDWKFAGLWAFIGVAIALFAFIFNYTMVPVSLPGYKFLVGPAMFALQFFSEETAFWPKLVIFMSGQYFAYFLIIFIARKLLKRIIN
ncbi:MAG: hypothetical protein KC484_11745 [Colwelliaceae bacterium]|nr:hypothetical protein [Colwelliaceae bacterium]